MKPPRWGTARDVSRATRSGEIYDLSVRFDVDPFEWQKLIFDTALEVDPVTGHYAYRVVGANVGRQNGKTLGASLRIGMELEHPGRRVAFTAQDRNLAFEKWDEHCELIGEAGLPIAKHIRGSGREELRMENGSRYTIFTPSGKGARGKTLDLVIIDEALTHDMTLIGAVEPTMATKPDAQLWLLSNAGDEGSTLLSHYRNLGHELCDNPERVNDARLAWFEWAPYDDRFDPLERDVWAQAIPTLDDELGVSEAAVSQAAHSQPADVFAREWLNVWASLAATTVIDPDDWVACHRPTVTLPPAGIVFGLDVAADRSSASIVAAGMSQGVYAVEVVDSRDGVGWVHDRIVGLCRQHRGKVAIDGGTNAAGSFIEGLERESVDVVTVSMKNYVYACGVFFDHVKAGTLAHPSDPRLDDAVAAGAKRNLSNAWAWERRSDVDMTPLIAATLALYGAVTVRAAVPAIH